MYCFINKTSRFYGEYEKDNSEKTITITKILNKSGRVPLSSLISARHFLLDKSLLSKDIL